MIDEEYPRGWIVRIATLGTSPNREAVATSPMQLCADKSCASDDHTASPLADEARFLGEALPVTLDEDP